MKEPQTKPQKTPKAPKPLGARATLYAISKAIGTTPQNLYQIVKRNPSKAIKGEDGLYSVEEVKALHLSKSRRLKSQAKALSDSYLSSIAKDIREQSRRGVGLSAKDVVSFVNKSSKAYKDSIARVLESYSLNAKGAIEGFERDLKGLAGVCRKLERKGLV